MTASMVEWENACQYEQVGIWFLKLAKTVNKQQTSSQFSSVKVQMMDRRLMWKVRTQAPWCIMSLMPVPHRMVIDEDCHVHRHPSLPARNRRASTTPGRVALQQCAYLDQVCHVTVVAPQLQGGLRNSHLRFKIKLATELHPHKKVQPGVW